MIVTNLLKAPPNKWSQFDEPQLVQLAQRRLGFSAASAKWLGKAKISRLLDAADAVERFKPERQP